MTTQSRAKFAGVRRNPTLAICVVATLAMNMCLREVDMENGKHQYHPWPHWTYKLQLAHKTHRRHHGMARTIGLNGTGHACILDIIQGDDDNMLRRMLCSRSGCNKRAVAQSTTSSASVRSKRKLGLWRLQQPVWADPTRQPCFIKQGCVM